MKEGKKKSSTTYKMLQRSHGMKPQLLGDEAVNMQTSLAALCEGRGGGGGLPLKTEEGGGGERRGGGERGRGGE